MATQGLHQGPLMSTPQGQTRWRDCIYLGNLQLLSNSYLKVPFPFVIKGEVCFSTASGQASRLGAGGVRLAGGGGGGGGSG